MASTNYCDVYWDINEVLNYNARINEPPTTGVSQGLSWRSPRGWFAFVDFGWQFIVALIISGMNLGHTSGTRKPRLCRYLLRSSRWSLTLYGCARKAAGQLRPATAPRST
jgi:hypothetical protein